MKNDFNLFTVYKSENSKYGIGGFKNYIIVLIFLIIAIFLAAGAINFVTLLTKNQTNSIITTIDSEKFATAKQDFDTAKNAYDNLTKYNSVLEDSQNAFDDSRFISADLLKQIFSCLTADTTVDNFKIISTDVLISCTSVNSASADIICQALNQTGLFSTVTYSSVTWDSGKSCYEYTINCTFAEVVK